LFVLVVSLTQAKVCSPSVLSDCKAGDTQTLTAYSHDEINEVLEFARQTYKADFNIFILWAEKSPLAVKAWIEMEQKLMSSKVLSASEIQVIALVTSNLNRCIYCMHFHTVLAQMYGISIRDAQEMRDGGLPDDRRLRTIAQATKLVNSKKGQLNAEDRDWCNLSGVTDAQLYEITANVGLITYANMLNLLQMPETDDAFRSGIEDYRLYRLSPSTSASPHTRTQGTQPGVGGVGVGVGGHRALPPYPHHLPPPPPPQHHRQRHGDL